MRDPVVPLYHPGSLQVRSRGLISAVSKIPSGTWCPRASMMPRLCLIGMLVPAAAFSGLASRLSATGAAPLLRRKSGAAPSTVPVSRLPAVVLSAEPWEATWDPLTGAASIARSGIIEADDDDTCDISKPSACGAPGSVPEWASQLNELQERGPGPSPGPTPTFALTKALLLRIATRILSPGVAAVLTLTLAAALVTEAHGAALVHIPGAWAGQRRTPPRHRHLALAHQHRRHEPRLARALEHAPSLLRRRPRSLAARLGAPGG